MLTATRPEATGLNEALLGDMYMRLERLEGELARLHAGLPNPPGSRATAADGGDGGGETKPVISLSGPTPRDNPWPAPRPSARDTPSPADLVGPEYDLLRVACDSNPAAVVALDGAGRVRLWNRAAALLFGWSAGEVLGSPPPFLPPDRREEHASLVRYPRSVLDGQELATVRCDRRGDGVPVRLSVAESRCGGVVFSLRPDAPAADRTPDPRPAMSPAGHPDAAVDFAADRTAGALVTLGRATAGVVHDFNNLLTAVLGSAGLLREGLDPAADSHHLATDIVTAAELGGAMCRDLLAVARPSPGTPAQTDLSRHARRYERLVRRVAGAGTALHLDLADGLPPGQVPQSEFAQVLLNLAATAAEGLASAGGTLTIATSVETVPPGRADWPGHVTPGRYVVLAVSDRGPGGSARLTPTRGVGLSVVGDILARHGGHLALEADGLSGTCVRAYFREA